MSTTVPSTAATTASPGMAPAGYLAKRVARRADTDWFANCSFDDIYAVSGCISEDFADYIHAWKHNGYWLFDSPALIVEAARELDADLAGTTLFYYEVCRRQYVRDGRYWAAYEPEADFTTAVREPAGKILHGYDVVSCSTGNAPECSFLSCNGMADDIAVNRHCLLATLDEAVTLLERGSFDNCEPGLSRIFAVYTPAQTGWPPAAG